MDSLHVIHKLPMAHPNLTFSQSFRGGNNIINNHSWRVGDPEKPQVAFGELFDDEQTQQHYEGLAATLKAAKKRGIVTYKSPILLKGAHDKVMVNLVDTSPQGESETTNSDGVSSKE